MTVRVEDRASGVAAYAGDWVGFRGIHVDPAHHGVRVKTWGGRGKEEPLGAVNHLGHRPLHTLLNLLLRPASRCHTPPSFRPVEPVTH